MMTLTVHSREPRSKRRRSQSLNKENVDAPEDLEEHPNDEEEVEGIDLHQQRYPWEGSDMDYLYDELAPFDLTNKKKKSFVVQDAIEDSAESHERHTICCLIVQEEFIEYIAEHPNDEEEVEGIDLHEQRYPWEGSDMDYLYDEVAPFDLTKKKTFVVQDAIEDSAESHGTHTICCLIVQEEFIDINLNFTEGILQNILMMRKRWRELICTSNVTRGRVDMNYLYDEDAIGDSAESHGRHIIRCLIVQEEFISLNKENVDAREDLEEHPNDEEEVEGIDLHQQRYSWEGSDMDYLYDESSFAQLLSMELTLEIDGAIFHVPNANASSNVDSQL
ncbi:hypothetical protein F2Q70_00010991 [Brassica cretica]|uniref:Uncharacterized protein n=1 Tax=Brassica cretica TaxID=69181 RepID=A0A8S9M787_BRACR|nr:hypothetical protein F2Q70_00010991 [Brassica cretica]